MRTLDMNIIVVYFEGDDTVPSEKKRLEMQEELYKSLPPGPTADEIDDYLNFLAATY